MISELQAYAIAALGGAALWQFTAMFGGRREAWDSPLYFTVAYPLAIVLAGVIAHLRPTRAWRFALVVMWSQAVVMTLTSGSGFSLLPLGLIMFGFLALPPIVIARVVSGAKQRREQGRT